MVSSLRRGVAQMGSPPSVVASPFQNAPTFAQARAPTARLLDGSNACCWHGCSVGTEPVAKSALLRSPSSIACQSVHSRRTHPVSLPLRCFNPIPKHRLELDDKARASSRLQSTLFKLEHSSAHADLPTLHAETLCPLIHLPYWRRRCTRNAPPLLLHDV
eukprot:5808596-Pleurochrysis_carterae.AAC.1